MGIFSESEPPKEEEGSMFFSGGDDKDIAPPYWMRNRKQTTPCPKRPGPKTVTITDVQVREALGLYLDYMFDVPHGTYSVDTWDFAFNEMVLTMKREAPLTTEEKVCL